MTGKGRILMGWLALTLAVLPARAGIELEDGDTFVFLGDSITHQCLYTQYVENFFYTRYPERRIHFHNAGVSGDKAADALARFEADVAKFKPKYVSMLLGMNDGTYLDWDQEIFATYEKGMMELLGKIDGLGATAIPMTPTMFDHHQYDIRKEDPNYRFGKDRSPKYNAVLAYYGAWLQERAVEKRLPFVNMWAPLNDLTMEVRRDEPDFTFITDAIHPVPGGQFIMAYSMLWQQKPERRSVSSIVITKKGSKWIPSKASGVKELKETSDGLEFMHKAKALPWVVPEVASNEELRHGMEPTARMAYDLVNAGHKLSNERVKISGLAPGAYEITIDGQAIGTFTHVQLGAKIELQSNEKTPQYQQALKVAMINRERNDVAVRELRNLWSKVKGQRRKLAAGGDQAGFDKAMADLKPQIEEKLALAKEYEDKIYGANQPVARMYVVRRVK